MKIKVFTALAIWAITSLLSCKSSQQTFRPGTEFGTRLKVEMNTKRSEPRALKLVVEYPEDFRGDTLEAAVSGGGKYATVALSSLNHAAKHVCVGGTLVAVANSKGLRGQDDNGVSTTVQTIRSAPTTMMVTQDVCTGQGEQLSCMPMTFPLETPGAESTVLHGDQFPLRFKTGSSMIFQVSEQPCLSSK